MLDDALQPDLIRDVARRRPRSPPSPSGRGVGGEGIFDAVHASALPYAFPIACGRRLAKRLKIPFFITPFLHLGNPDDPDDRTRRGYTSPALCWLLKEADGIFVQTPSEREAACEMGVSSDKIILQGLGVEPSECTGGDRFAARERWNLPPDAFVVGHLANNSWEKGTNDLIDSLVPLWQQGRPVHLLLAGPQMPNFTSYWQAFEKRCPDFAKKYVRRLGPITDTERRDFLRVDRCLCIAEPLRFVRPRSSGGMGQRSPQHRVSRRRHRGRHPTRRRWLARPVRRYRCSDRGLPSIGRRHRYAHSARHSRQGTLAHRFLLERQAGAGSPSNSRQRAAGSGQRRRKKATLFVLAVVNSPCAFLLPGLTDFTASRAA